MDSKKMRKLRLEIVMMAVGLTLMLAAPAKATIIGSPVYNNGHFYYLLDGKPWVNQEAEAVGLAGHLVTINDAAENTFVWNRFGVSGTGLFIGFNDAAVEGTWVWSSGEPVTFTNWRAGEPNNSGGNEDYGELGSDFTSGTMWARFIPGGASPRALLSILAVTSAPTPPIA